MGDPKPWLGSRENNTRVAGCLATDGQMMIWAADSEFDQKSLKTTISSTHSPTRTPTDQRRRRT